MNDVASAASALNVTGPLPATFKISSFPSPATVMTRPTFREVTLDQLRTLLGTHERRRDKDGRGWSGATYKPGTTRANKNVVEWSVAGADFDHFTMDEYMELRAVLVEADLTVFLYSTYNSTPDDFRFRVAIPFTKPVPNDRYTDVWHRMNASLFLGKNDPQTKDASRMLYTPAAPEDVAVVAEYIPGQALDWEMLPEAPAASRRSTVGPASAGQAVGISRDVLLFTVDGAPTGQQRGMALRAARAFLATGKTVDETVDLVWRGLRASPVGDEANPWTEEQAREIVEDLAGREPTPLEEWPELKVEGRVEAGTNGRQRGPTLDGDGEDSWFSPGRANGHHDAPADNAGSEPQDTDTDERPWTLDRVLEKFHRWLYLPDDGVVLATLAAAAANYMEDDPDPCWLLVVGGSAGGKTEILMSLAGLRQVRVAASINVAGLLSGTPKRDREKGTRGGLLMEIGRFGLIVLKDFTTIISQNRDARAETLAALREVYDGRYVRNVGVDGGKTLEWSGKLGVVGAVTDAIDTAHAVVGALGERFTYYRLPPNDGADIRKDLAERALSNGNMLAQMRRELAEAVAGLFGAIEIPARPPIPEGDDRERLIALASLVARCRSAVERDYKTREIELVYSPESPARIAQALARLSAGLRVIGVEDARRWEVLRHVGLSSMPKTRRAVLDHLAASTERLTTATVAGRIRLPTQTTRRCLEDLTAHHVANRYPGGDGKADKWSLTDDARAEYVLAVTVPGTSERVYSDDSPNNHTDIPSDDIPGTADPSGADDGRRHCWSCEAELLEELDESCAECGWLACRCGACGCDRGRQAG